MSDLTGDKERARLQQQERFIARHLREVIPLVPGCMLRKVILSSAVDVSDLKREQVIRCHTLSVTARERSVHHGNRRDRTPYIDESPPARAGEGTSYVSLLQWQLRLLDIIYLWRFRQELKAARAAHRGVVRVHQSSRPLNCVATIKLAP